MSRSLQSEKMQNFLDANPGVILIPFGQDLPPLQFSTKCGKTTFLQEIDLSKKQPNDDLLTFDGRFYRLLKRKPILITEDSDLLISLWCQELGLPSLSPDFFTSFINNHFSVIKKFFPDAVLLRTRDFVDKINRLAKKEQQPFLDWPTFRISLDGDLLPDANMVIEITRVRDPHTHRMIGVLARPGEITFKEQMDRLRYLVPSRHNIEILVDGCWSGNEVLMLREELSKRGLEIDKVISGTLTKTGLRELENYGLKVFAAFPYFGLVSWICQRDFLPGTPRSGLNLATQTGKHGQLLEDVGAPYILPFREDFFTALSIHDRIELAAANLELTDQLFSALEQRWGRTVLIQNLKRRPCLIPTENKPFRWELRRLAKTRLGA